MGAQLQPADGEGELIQPRVGEQPRQALEASVERLVRARPGAGELGLAQGRALQQGPGPVGKPFVLGLPPGGGEALDEADQFGVCYGQRRLLS